MGSLYLNGLTPEQRKALEQRLLEQQQYDCFICGAGGHYHQQLAMVSMPSVPAHVPVRAQE